MRSLLGVVVLLGGLLSIVVAVIVGQSGVTIPGNILGLYSPVTGILFYGGAVVAFIGFSLMMLHTPSKV